MDEIKWPVFESHEVVTCWSCKQLIEGAPGSAEFAAGQGQYNKICQCGVVTWYDIREQINQCDGCRRGLPLKNGLHIGKSKFDMVGCTKDRYELRR